jgi:hypothetical protein
MRIEIEPAPNTDEHLDQENREREGIRSLANSIATLLDAAFYLPGTNIRIGLDPLLGLIPGLGDIISNLIGSSLLFLATRLGVPKIVIFRMALNVSCNMILGAVPGFGDLFSFWYRSNIRNAQLLQRYCRPSPPPSTATDWIYVIGLITGMFGIFAAFIFALVWAIGNIWHLIG